MRMYDLIYAKKTGNELSKDQIDFWIKGLSSGNIPDDQSVALLMAICWRGMTKEETITLTAAMQESGSSMDLSGIQGLKVDKHSTGGVGDKTTLIIGPIVAACGVLCAMLSGRGLGHTGGTVDKYSSIPGLKVELGIEDFKASLLNTGFANSAQTSDICPADRKIYALRDVTATVESVHLIASSIMSKKIAGGCDALLLDVKCGHSAFMKTIKQSRSLAECMVEIGKANGMRVKAFLTRMEEPLGWAIGNSLEVMESVEILKGMHPESDLARMSFRMASEMLIMGGAANDLETAQNKVNNAVDSGKAMDAFRKWVAFNGGNPKALDDFDLLPQSEMRYSITANKNGYIQAMDGRALGILAMELGAGRRKVQDQLDLGVGIRLHKHVGDAVKTGEIIFTAHTKAGIELDVARFLSALRIGPKRPVKESWLLEIVE